MNYWLFKSEPSEYSIEDLAAEPDATGVWDGIRNYQARNTLRDEVKPGDCVFFYHSSCQKVGIAGTMVVVKAGYPDPAQFDADSHYYDAKAEATKPRWYCVDVRHQETFDVVVPLSEIKQNPSLVNMALVKQSRLSIQPVTASEWKEILAMRNQ